MAGPDKAAGAFRTIGEVSRDTGVPQHILRYWESRFAQLRPLQRAGNRRYYRPDDVALVRRIDDLLNVQGYTIGGVQKLLASEARGPSVVPTPAAPVANGGAGVDWSALAAIRALLAQALAAG
ncbi:MAG: MerR family transcriptional regulator [Sphingomonas sp.]|uniref:MerR family transcriptional regulator n=1 Tax=Sphingomonas sp. TaxID=28214 RepID=UPI001AD49C27|nr:MerR family transcriptional regulator [Sphingomonas sp.]MBN8809227.1 MerR family transcriptional regulator [Sphingomonas sp.]